jgi:phosphoribosylformylglycinamidine synthase
MKVRVLVSFKDSVLDPQGQTVKNALHTMGYAAVKDVRQGKVFELVLDGISEPEAPDRRSSRTRCWPDYRSSPEILEDEKRLNL